MEEGINGWSRLVQLKDRNQWHKNACAAGVTLLVAWGRFDQFQPFGEPGFTSAIERSGKMEG
jgi:hypothetical protein